MNRRTLLKQTGGIGIAALGLGTAAASASTNEPIHPDACPKCPDDICPEGCNACYEIDC